MTLNIAIVLVILVFGIVLFVTELFSIDVTAMLLLTILLLLGYLSPSEAISGFSNPAVITIALLFILSRALEKTGLLEYLVVRINRLTSQSKFLGNTVYLMAIGFASAFVNNTAIVALFIPVTIRMAKKLKTRILTTEKDYIRLSKNNKKNIDFIKVQLVIKNKKNLVNFLKTKL